MTVKNTGLNPLSGSIDVDLEVKEVLGGTDTVVYSNDFDGNSGTSNCSQCAFTKTSYTGDYESGASSWHIESNSTAATENVSWYEADSNPTDYYWGGMDYGGSNESNSGYFNNMDEALILENVDLTGADAAYLSIQPHGVVSETVRVVPLPNYDLEGTVVPSLQLSGNCHCWPPAHIER